MEIGLPEFLKDLDLIGGFFWFLEKIPLIIGGVLKWLVASVGGNYVAAALILGFCIYVPIDMFIYHRFLDKGAANLGDWIARVGGRIILFFVVAAVMYVLVVVA